jgi:hypothetical protein
MAVHRSALVTVRRTVSAGTWICLFAAASARAQEAGVGPPDVPPPSAAAGSSGASDNPGSAPAPAAEAPPPSASRAAEEAEIAAELAQIQGRQPSGAGAPAAPQPAAAEGDSSGASASSRGLSNLMNPAISVAGVAYAGGTTRKESAVGAPADLRNGITLQEIELRASAIVDPYFRADVALTGNADAIEFEEAYITTLEIPRVTLRAGQMKATVGRHNLLHTHAFPFITAPLPWRVLIGPEGLNDPGVSADVLLPLPFYTELTTQVFAGEWLPFEGSVADNPRTARDESVPDQRHDRDLAYVAHAKTLFELSDSTTLELGASYVGGRNGFGGMTNVVAGDVTLKWKPIEAERYEGFDWTTEYIWVERGGAITEKTRGGGYTAVRYQFAQRWWVQTRGAILGLPAADDPRTYRVEALVAFVPSEFSAIRLQYGLEHEAESGADYIHELFAQVVFSVGPHPAHAY